MYMAVYSDPPVPGHGLERARQIGVTEGDMAGLVKTDRPRDAGQCRAGEAFDAILLEFYLIKQFLEKLF